MILGRLKCFWDWIIKLVTQTDYTKRITGSTFELTNNFIKGMRNDLNEKFLPTDANGNPQYYVTINNANYDSLVGCNQIQERTLVNQSEMKAGYGINKGYQYRYIDTNNNAQSTTLCASGNTLYRNWDTTPVAIYTNLQIGPCNFATYQNKCFIFNGKNYPLVYDGTIGIVSEMGAPVPLAGTVAGSPNGAYKYACTFVTDGGEEYIGTVSPSITVASLKIEVSLPIGYDGTLTRNLYRTIAGGAAYYLVANIPDNTTLTYEDNMADANLLTGADQLSNLTTLWHFNETSGTMSSDTKGNSNLSLAGTFFTADFSVNGNPPPIWYDINGATCANNTMTLSNYGGYAKILTNTTGAIQITFRLGDSGGQALGFFLENATHSIQVIRKYIDIYHTRAYIDGTVIGNITATPQYFRVTFTPPRTYLIEYSTDGTNYTTFASGSLGFDFTPNDIKFMTLGGAAGSYGIVYSMKVLYGGSGVGQFPVFTPGLLNNALSFTGGSNTASWIPFATANMPTGTTTLSGNITNIVQTIPVVSTAAFPPGGVFLITSEQITYTSKDATHFYGCTRGANGTSNVSHTSGDTVGAANVFIQGSTNIDFQVSGWIKISENTGDSLSLNYGGAKLIFAGASDATQTAPAGKATIIWVDNSVHTSTDNFPVNKYFYFEFKRVSGTITLEWTAQDETNYNATVRITLTDTSALNSNALELDAYLYAGTTNFIADELRTSNTHSFSTAINTFWWNKGAGTESTYDGGGTPLIAANNECPRVYFGQVAADRLAGCVSTMNPSQLWITTTFNEVFDNSVYVEVTSEQNDNTPLVGMVNDYKYLIVGSQKNIYMVDAFQETPSCYVSRANVGVYNGYTMVNLPPYKDFEGGVMFMSSLKDFRIFNSNFSQPIISTSSESANDEDWSRAIDNTIQGLASNTKDATFFQYKYHVSFGSIIAVFDIRNSGWSTMSGQDANCFILANDKLYCGRSITSYIDQMYSAQTNNGLAYTCTIASGALGASEALKFFRDLYIDYSQNGLNSGNLQIIYEDDVNNSTNIPLTLYNPSAPGNYDPTNAKDTFVVVHLNRRARWLKFILTFTADANHGRFFYRGFRLKGDIVDKD